MRRLVALALALVLLGPWPRARAQSADELAEARRLFEAGLAAASDHRWAEARASFEQSLAITERASTLLNLAAAQAETGAVVASAESYRRFLEIATGRDARHRDEAEAALARVGARVAHLEIDTSRLERGDAVELDEHTLLPSALEEPIALDAGSHHVAVLRRGDVVFEDDVTLAEGARFSMTIDVGERAPEPEAVALPIVATTTETTTDTPSGGDDGVAIGVGIGVTVGVLAIAGAVIGIVFATMPTSTGDVYMGNVGDGVIRF